ncbi:MAG: Ig-like domain-containing protein [Candidatus Aminicenantes bacterium]|jgi:hypothetical protein
MQGLLKRLIKMFIFFLFFWFCFPFLQFPEGGFNISKIGEWGGYGSSYYDVAVSGSYAYCAAGTDGLDIIDISIPSSPQLIASFKHSPFLFLKYQDVEVAGNRAYTISDDILYIIDVSSPTTPSLWGSVTLSGYGGGLGVKSQYVYVVNGYDQAIDIIDISGSTPPTTIVTYNAGCPVNNIHINGDYLYVAAGDSGVQILNISVPISPVVVSEIKNSNNYVSHVFAAGNYAYVVYRDYGLIIYDISSPQSPTKVGEYLDVGDYGIYRVYVKDSLAFLPVFLEGLKILDVTNPSTPVLKATYQYPEDSPKAFHKEGPLLYIADWYRGLRIIDITDPASPLWLGSLENFGRANTSAQDGNYLYIGKKYGLHIIDISNPSVPLHVGFAETDDEVHALAIDGSYAFVSLGFYNTRLQVYNVSNPTRPVQVAEVFLAPSQRPDFISINGDYAYVDSGEGIKVFDISDPTTPTQTGLLAQYGSSFIINGNYGYLLSTDKLNVIDISSISTPQVLNTISLGYYPEAMAIEGNYAYIIDWSVFLVYDLSDPVSPSLLWRFTRDNRFNSITVEGNYAYLLESNTIHVIDFSNPLSPISKGFYSTNVGMNVMMVHNGFIYLQDYNLLVLRFQFEEMLPQIALDPDTLYFGAETTGIKSKTQWFLLGNAGGGTLKCDVLWDADWLECSAGYNFNTGRYSVRVDTDDLDVGLYTGTLTVQNNLSYFDTKTITVYLQVYDPSETSVPFGEFATPTDNAVVSSSVPFTGWVLDDIGVEGVKLYLVSGKALTPIGDAVFSAGARPDVESAYPNYPQAYKAGWGYMMLTNFLPNGGNGTYTIRAVATDMEGNSVTLGNKTIYVDNANAVKPFGAIDTPEQGGMAQGDSYINFGWVLTPLPNTIPQDGSTIRVWVDGKSLGNPVYNQYRSDIQDLFPGYNNSSGAGGNFTLDTSQFTNGVHTIQWTATDNAGNTDGIGSRYFSIYNAQNQGTSATSARNYTTTSTMKPLMRNSPVEVDTVTPVRIKKGFTVDGEEEDLYPADNGEIFVEIKELERVEIVLLHPEQLAAHTGNIVVEPLYPLPSGASLQAQRGIFSWMPGVGFVGDYSLAFLVKEASGMVEGKVIRIRIRIRPKY